MKRGSPVLQLRRIFELIWWQKTSKKRLKKPQDARKKNTGKSKHHQDHINTIKVE